MISNDFHVFLLLMERWGPREIILDHPQGQVNQVNHAPVTMGGMFTMPSHGWVMALW